MVAAICSAAAVRFSCLRLTITTSAPWRARRVGDPAADAGGTARDEGDLSQEEILAKDVNASHF